MATNYSERGGFSAGRSSSTGGFGTSRSGSQGSTTAVPPQYKQVNKAFANKIDSFKTLFNQTRGAATKNRPTTAILNTFANWVNKGAVVQTVSCAQIAKWARANNQNFSAQNPTPTACKTVLARTFGKTTIKACARTKTGGFMVATSPTWKGKTFCFPK